MKNRFAHLLSMVVLVGSVLFVFSTAMAATVIIVTTTADTIADDGQCSLREAVIAANTDSPVGGCPAGSGADTITFASSLPQPATFQLTLTGAGEDNAATGDLDVIGQLTITGQGTAQTILDGNGTDRVLDIQPGANLSLSSLTVRNGTSINGGGISSVGRLTLKDVTLQSNNGDGLLNNGGLATLTNVTVKDNLGGYGILNQGQGSLTFTGGEVSGNQNGGIYNTVATAILTNIKVLNNSGAGGVANVGTATSRLSMTGCVVSNNTSTTSGGGIKSDGAQNIVDIHDTTISSNLATAAGGGIFNIGTMSVSGSTIDHNSSRSGAGIDHFGGVLSLMNDTISANTASDNGGGLYNRGNATLTNVTFSTNRANGAGTGGNIFIDTASLTLKNTIVSGSEADGNCVNNGGTIISLGHNLESANSCSFTVTSDLPNTAPLLGALQDNGGPTFTQALQAGSPAIDRGDNNGCPTTDQRGFSRPVDGDANGSAVCDIGSFELNGVSPSPTFTPTPTSTQTATPTPTGTLTNTPTSTPTPTPTSTGVPTPNPVSISKASGIGAINLDGQNLNPWSNKAFFQFQIRYRSGDIAPTGHIFYLDPKAHLFLVSKSFDQLVINGSSAKFTGLATVNGSKNVSFEVNVIDYGDRQGDDTLWKNHDPMDEFRIGIPSLDNYLVGGTLAEGNITIRVKNRNADTTGVFRPGNGAIFLKNANTTGFADVAINYGLPGDYPVVGDWDGNGTATIGVYRNGVFFLRNSNTNGFAEIVFAFGTPGDQPVAGDWNGDGIDSVGVYRSSTGEFLLRDSNSAGAPDASFSLGNPGDIGLAGDWDGDGIDTTGVFRPSNGVIFLKNSNSTGFADIELNYGMSGDRPVTGDWNADGVDTIGIYRNGVFYLRNSNTIGFADLVFGLGIPGDIPIAGDWDGLP